MFDRSGMHARIGQECSASSLWWLALSPVAEALVPTTDRQIIGRGIGPVPAGSAMIVERSLGPDVPCVELSLCTIRGDGSDAILAGHHHERDLPPIWLEEPVWRSIRDHYRHWMERGSVLQQHVQSTWLEFDRDQLACRCSLPSIFLGFRDISRNCRQSVHDIILDRFVAPAARAQVGAAMNRVLSSLPARAELRFVGVMLPRDQTRVRLCIMLPLSELMDFTTRIAFPARDQMGRLIAFSARHAVSAVLHLDVGDRLGATLGIELKPIGRDGWPLLLSHLNQEGLCTAVEREALLAFPGRSGVARNGSGPTGVADGAIGSPDMWRDVHACLIARSLNHVKLVCQPNCAVKAKVYMHIGYLWRKRALNAGRRPTMEPA